MLLEAPITRARSDRLDVSGGIALPLPRSLSTVRLNPRTHPRFTLGMLSWALGLYLALFATPSPPSPKAYALYEARMADADLLLQPRSVAAQHLRESEALAYQSRVWFWRFRGEPHTGRVREADALVRSARQSFRVVEKKHSAALRLARSELGLWSDAGVEAARGQFWQQYKEGKRFAQRSTFYDVLFAVIQGRTPQDESVINFVLNCTLSLHYRPCALADRPQGS